MKLSHSPILTQKLSIRQTLSPKIIQMLNLFQKSYADFIDEAHAQVENNVLLDIIQEDTLLFKLPLPTPKQEDITEFLPSTSGISLYDSLVHQIEQLHLSKDDHAMSLMIIAQLDAQGFISNYTHIKETIKALYSVSDRKVNDLLKIIQSCEPEGVGSRNLQECLLIQIHHYQFENDTLRGLLRQVVTRYLQALAEKNYALIAKDLDLDIKGVVALAEFISQNLTPDPGAPFRTSSSRPLIPSLYCEWKNDTLILTNLEKKQGIQVGLSEHYLKLISDPSADKQTKEYLEKKLEKAKEWIEIVQKRQENLEKVAFLLMSKQILFLKKGPLYLNPFLQKDLAQALDINPSTLSRILNSKYIDTPHGMFALKQLCPRSHFGKTSEKLKAIVAQCIQENKAASDQKITLILNKDGIPIARRTVTKFRQLSDIQNSYKRHS